MYQDTAAGVLTSQCYSSSNHHPSLPVVRGKTAGQFCFPSILFFLSVTGAGAYPSCHMARGGLFSSQKKKQTMKVTWIFFFFSLTGPLVLPECSHRWQSWCELSELRCLMCDLHTLTHLLLSLTQSINVVCVCVCFVRIPMNIICSRWIWWWH